MSRSNPNQHQTNPATRFFEWNGENGNIRYYDKEKKANVEIDLPFTFLLLDELACVNGWHDASSSGIYSNEVRDTRTDVMVVKAFKGGTLAEGLYKDFRDRVAAQGGKFNANCYIAFKGPQGLQIGSLKFKGAALGAWMEFRKANRNSLYSSAIAISGFTEGQKGRIVYKMPAFSLKPVSTETNAEAVALDKTLQQYLEGYLSRKTDDKADTIVPTVADDDMPVFDINADMEPLNDLPDDSSIPF